MPPQQGERLADGVGEFFNFGPHGGFLMRIRAMVEAWR
jgi:hypothetical protein